MTRYGNTPVSKIKSIYNSLREAIRTGDLVEANKALDEYEPFCQIVYQEEDK